MTQDRIFGYTWNQIQRAQRGDIAALREAPPPCVGVGGTWTQADQELLDQHRTAEALDAAGWCGTADRARRQNRKPTTTT